MLGQRAGEIVAMALVREAGMREPGLRLNAWTRIWLPYQFMAIEVGKKKAFLPVNRDYRPLGLGGSAKLTDVAEYMKTAVIFTGDPHKFEGVWSDPDELYLYGDDQASRADYFQRLGRLSAKTVKLAAGK